jgi:hypothetical protein
MLSIISLGAGVQSTTMALMAAHGDITPIPDCAIFADTGDEPQTVYRHLDWLEENLPFPVHRVRRPGLSLGAHIIETVQTKSTRTASPPFFTKDPDGMLPRQCSSKFKVRPIQHKVRELLGLTKGERMKLTEPAVEQWLGISWDEAIRMRPSSLSYIKHRYPLIEREMSRHHCLRWMQQHGYPRPPKSACVFCPYHDRKQWRSLRDQPDDWAKAVTFDAAIRAGPRGLKGTMFVHRQRVPLDQADFSTAEDHGQLNLFLNECEGMCGI